MNLLLDDFRDNTDVFLYKKNKIYLEKWEIVRNYDEFVNFIEKYYNNNHILPDVISFDHDLSDEHYGGDYTNEKTGLNCIKWFVSFVETQNIDNLPIMLFHSMNVSGKQNMESYWNSYLKSKKM